MTDVWVKQLETGPLSRISLEGVNNVRTTWSPNSESLTFASDRAGILEYDLWTKRSDGGGSAERASVPRSLPQLLDPILDQDELCIIVVSTAPHHHESLTVEVYPVRDSD